MTDDSTTDVVAFREQPVEGRIDPPLHTAAWSRQEFIGIVMLTLLAFVLRLWMRPMVVWPLGDAVHYLNQARFGPWEGTWSPVGEQWWLPPLYPWLISMLLGGSTDPTVTLDRAVLVNILAGTLLGPALYWTARPLLGTGAAFWTQVLATVLPFLVAYSATAITEPLYMLLLVLLWGCALRWAHGNERLGMYAVPLLGVALFLTRAFGIIQFPLVFLGVWWTKRQLGSCDKCFVKHAVSAWAIFLVATGVVIGKTTLEQGEFAIDGKSRYQFMRLAAPDLTSETPDPNYEGKVTANGLHYAPLTPWFEPLTGNDYVIGQAKKYLLRQRRLWLQWLTAAIPPYSLPLFDPLTLLLIGAGCLLLRRDTLPAGWRTWPPLLAGLILIQPLTFVEPRYFVSLVPLTLPLAGLALEALAEWLSVQGKSLFETRITRTAVGLALLAGALLVLAPYAQWTRSAEIQYNPPQAMAATLRERFPSPPQRIFDTAGSTAYYLGAEGWVIPDVDPAGLQQFARQHGITALVLDERMARGKHNRSLLTFLYDVPDDYPDYGFTLLDWEEHPDGRSWRVYAIGP